MTARRDPDRLIHTFLLEGAEQLQDQAYDAVRAVIEHKRQRVVIGPWRMPTVNKIVPIGLGAAAVVVALVVGSQFLPRTPSGVGAEPSATPSPTVEPSVAAPSPSPASAPPLTQSFTSTVHGISLSYPEGWTARAATEPWTKSPGEAEYSDPGSDVLHDSVLTDHLFLQIVSQPIGDSTTEDWVAASIADFDCTTTAPIAVDGATGLIGADDCDTVAVTTAGRGYRISLYKSDDDPVVVAPYDRAWFEQVLATVRLHPGDAVD